MKVGGIREGHVDALMRDGPTAPAIDATFLRVEGSRYYVKGVTYGTFIGAQGRLFPAQDQVRRDFEAMAAVGVNTVRTYTVPDEHMLALAAALGLRLLVGIWWTDPRYLHPPTPASWAAMERSAHAEVRRAVTACSGHPGLLGFLIGNEIPGPVVRWHGRKRVEALLQALLATGKQIAPEALFGYANYPTTGYLNTGVFDFEAVNVFLEDEGAFRGYLAQLQVANPDRPILLTEIGLDSASHGERKQAEVLDWQLRAALEGGAAGTCVFAWTDEWAVGGQPVDGWSFGLTDRQRRPKPALSAVATRYRDGLLGCRSQWPGVSVVVCAYREEATIGNCLRSLTQLRYPEYEVIVVDDGSDDATAEIASRFPVDVLSPGRVGLSSARNLGLGVASGEIIAYIDADAMADPDWLTYLVLGLDADRAVAVGGPNLVPPSDPPVAQCIARAPGGPIHVLIDDQRAEHIPGCNMAFRRAALQAVGGFDPLFRAAGDDVDICWRLQDVGGVIRFHPAALVFHHPRSRVRDFWRQQVGYGRAEALVERRHPDRFEGPGRARWQGVVYSPAALFPGRGTIYGGQFGQAPFQRLYRGTPGVDLVSALVGVAALAIPGVLEPALLVVPLLALLGLLGRCLVHGLKTARRDHLRPVLPLGIVIGLLHVLQPLAREYGRLRHGREAFDRLVRGPAMNLEGPGRYVAEGVADLQRPSFLGAVQRRLRAHGLRVTSACTLKEADLSCETALAWRAELVSYSQQNMLFMRVRHRLHRPRPAVLVGLALVLAAGWSVDLVLPVLIIALGTLAADGWRLRWRLHRALTKVQP